jgi:hypothetical protein
MFPRSMLAAAVLAVSLPATTQRLVTTPVPTAHPDDTAAHGGAAAPASEAGGRETTIDDQVEVALTVYNSSLSLVRDVREVRLVPGDGALRFIDVAATVKPATVHLRSLTDPSQVSVLEQNYEYDLLEPDKLLRKYVGREVTLIRKREENGTTREETVRATLVSFNGAPIWKIGGEYVTGLHADHVRFPELPATLYSRPTLLWSLTNRGAPRHRLEVSYLAERISWNADYVLTVSRDDSRADLDGWVTLANQSGTEFRNARLQLVAGDLHRVASGVDQDEVMAERAMKLAASAPAMTQEAFAEYHLYTLGRRTTVANNETKQLSLLSGTGVPVQKRFVVDGRSFYYRNVHRPGSPLKDQVKVFYRLRNAEAGGLGMPMPAGTVRVYQADTKGGLQFVGEDRIDHTPKDETLDLQIGTAFDVVAERKQTDFERVSDDVFEVAFEVTLRNHKATPITVEVNEPIGGSWRMVQHSHAWTKTDAWAAQFAVPVAAEGTATLRYRVRVTY